MGCLCRGGMNAAGDDAARDARPAAAGALTASRGWMGTSVRTLLRWAPPVATLALMPKCPVCVAGYVLLLTGVGISASAAAMLRWGLVSVSILALAYLAVRTVRAAMNRKAMADRGLGGGATDAPAISVSDGR